MSVYILCTEYQEYNLKDITNKCVSFNLTLICDILIECFLATSDKLEEKIKEACVFKTPDLDITASLEDYHLQMCLNRVFFSNDDPDSYYNVYIEKRNLITENTDVFEDYDVFSLFYSFNKKQFVIGSIEVYPSYNKRFKRFESENIVDDVNTITSSPLLDKLNMWFKYYYEESLNTIVKR